MERAIINEAAATAAIPIFWELIFLFAVPSFLISLQNTILFVLYKAAYATAFVAAGQLCYTFQITNFLLPRNETHIFLTLYLYTTQT